MVLHGVVILEQTFCMETVIFVMFWRDWKKGFQIKVKLLHNIILKNVGLGLCCCFSEYLFILKFLSIYIIRLASQNKTKV